MKVKSLLLISSLSLVACGDNDDNQNDYQYGRLKSDPPMPPLTYTWSHPDCPFTANFPGKPEEEIIEQEDGTKLIAASFSSPPIALNFQCDYQRLSTNDQMNEELYDLYIVKTNTEDFDKKTSVKSTIFSKLKYAKFYYLQKTNYDSEFVVSDNNILFHHNETLATASYFTNSQDINTNDGVEFFESIKLK